MSYPVVTETQKVSQNSRMRKNRATIHHSCRGRSRACPSAMTGTEAGHYRAPTRGAPTIGPGHDEKVVPRSRINSDF
ncbi:hypothetical protein Desti_5423 [Desulfomonile tiedjei DSM 6799]|uniref:Uncharacterized protein n=1 Tax=Desulfomonile tiedjei (strain ATCC 49306 / DSM 6799 / DCB-1) TaxID=706587 RepID=I4CEL9_DESTA|nr:hypothetical protein Desti_5423 [Desulfomonile tiedjei DSM 6799]